MDSFHIWYIWSIAWEGVWHVMTLDHDLYLQGHSTLTLKEGVLRVKFITKFQFFANFGPIFSGQQHTPIDFQTKTPPHSRRWHLLIYLVQSCIFCHFSTHRRYRYLKSFCMENKVLIIYHTTGNQVGRCPGDARSQRISRHGIGLVYM